MIITRAPYRVSFMGGGTDFFAWYREHKGAVLSVTIDKYCYILARWLPPFFEHKHRIVWSHIELPQRVDEIQHPAVREALRYLGIEQGIEIHHGGDLPARTGMGTSSSFTVALLHALTLLKGKIYYKDVLAKVAYEIEQKYQTIGFQDQIAVSFGGLNRIDFESDSEFIVKPLRSDKLEQSVMLFLTGFQRDASRIEKEKLARIKDNGKGLERLYKLVQFGEVSINDMRSFGELVSEGWQIKRSMAPGTSTEYIDYLYEKGMRAGAYGGKLLGAGGGGVLCFIVPPERQDEVKTALQSLIYIPAKFSYQGSELIINNGA